MRESILKAKKKNLKSKIYYQIDNWLHFYKARHQGFLLYQSNSA